MLLVRPLEKVGDFGVNYKMVFNVQRQLAMRRRGRSFGSYARPAAAALGAGWRLGQKLRSALSGASKKRTETGFVTNQYDVKTTYRKRRMPRYKKRRWLRFKKRVLYAENSIGAKQCLVFRRVLAPTVASNSQSVTSCLLYGNGQSTGVGVSNVDVGCMDMQDVWDAWRNTAAGSENESPGKINFTSAVLDVEIGNLGGEGYNNSLTIDVYHVRCKKMPNSVAGINIQGFADLFNASLTSSTMPNMSSNNTIQLDDAQAGITPFCSPLFCQHVEILSVKKVLLSVGQNTHFQLRLSKDKVYSHSERIYNIPALERGVEGYMFIVQGVTSSSEFSVPCKYVVNATRTYHFRVNDAYSVYGGLAATSS